MRNIYLTALVLLGLIVAMGSVSAVNADWAVHNNVTLTGTFDNGSSIDDSVKAGGYVAVSEAVSVVNAVNGITIDRVNTSIANYMNVNVTYNISNSAMAATGYFNVSSITIELIGLDMNTSTNGFILHYNGTNATTGATTVADSDGDGLYEATFTIDNHGPTNWRIPFDAWRGETSNVNDTINISLEQQVRISVATEGFDIDPVPGSAGLRVIGLGAASTEAYGLVNHTFEISVGSPFVNSTLNVTYYFPVNSTSDNGSVQLFWLNGSDHVREWVNATANVTLGLDNSGVNAQGNAHTLAFQTLIGWGNTPSLGATYATNGPVSNNDTATFTVQYLVPGPYMSANTSILAGMDDTNPTDGFEREIVVTMNDTTDLHAKNVEMIYRFNDELYESEDGLQLRVWSDNLSKWFDITPSKDCATASRNLFTVHGETYQTCKTDADGNSKLDSFNITIPRLSTVKFHLTGDVMPGRLIVNKGSVQVCGDGICGHDETSNQCPADCLGAQPTQPTAYTPRQIVTSELPNLQPIHIIGILAVIFMLLYAWKKD